MAQQGTALQVVKLSDATLTPLQVPEITERLTRCLFGNKRGLTPRDLLVDLAGVMTGNPSLQACSAISIYNTLVFAAQHHLTFGVGGVWPVPFGETNEDGTPVESNKTKQCTPVLDYRAMVNIAHERHGVQLPVEVVFVYKGEKFKEVKQGGVTISVDHEVDYEIGEGRTSDKFMLAYTIISMEDGRTRAFVRTKAQLDLRKAISKAKGKRSPWQVFTLPMYAKTMERLVMAILVPDFKAAMGGAGPAEDGDEADILDITPEAAEQPPQPKLTQSQQLTEELKGRTEKTPPPADTNQNQAVGQQNQSVGAPAAQETLPTLGGEPIDWTKNELWVGASKQLQEAYKGGKNEGRKAWGRHQPEWTKLFGADGIKALDKYRATFE